MKTSPGSASRSLVLFIGGLLSLVLAATTQGAPVITGFAPVIAPVGSNVTINGVGFSPTPANNIVRFGAVRATVATASATTLRATVPPGATYGPITVTLGGYNAYSVAPFLPTFPGNGSPLSQSSFSPRADLTGADGPQHTVIADLDGDGKPDLVVANVHAHHLSLFRNISAGGSLNAGSFQARVDLPAIPSIGPAPTDNPYAIVAADMDADGKLDIVVCDRLAGQVAIYRNISTVGTLDPASFAPPVAFAVGADPRHVRVADLNGDSRPDIVTANFGLGTVSILQNTGVAGGLSAGSFGTAVTLTAGAGAFDVALGDVDGDMKVDVAVANLDALFISVFKNTTSSGGTITPATLSVRVDFPAADGSDTIVFGDLDGDGKSDLVTGSSRENTISVYRNQAAFGSLSASSFAPKIDFAAAGRVHTVRVGDLNGDARLDVALVTELESRLSLFGNIATPGTFTDASLAPRVDLATGLNAWGVSVGDLDADGRPDLVFCNADDDTVSVCRNETPLAGAPIIVTLPLSQLVDAGDSVTFHAAVSGSLPLSWQWKHNGDNLPVSPNYSVLANGTNCSLTILNAQAADAGTYAVAVTNSLGGTISGEAVLTVNRPPTATDQAVTPNEDTVAAITLAGVDPDGDALTYAVATPPTRGSLGGIAPALVYTPDPNYSGPDSFTFIANDGRLNSAEGTVTITVLPVNDPPVVLPASVSVTRNSSVAIGLSGFDIDGDGLTFQVVGAPAHGTLSGSAPNLTYTPSPDYTGPDSFTFKANDGAADSAEATVSITVTGPETPLVAMMQVRPLLEFSGATNLVVLSLNNSNATVILDGSASAGDPLSYDWFDGANLIATGMITTNTLDVGTHELTLVITRGPDIATDTKTVEVVSAAGAADILAALVEDSALSDKSKTPLFTSLNNAAAAFDRGQINTAINVLGAFQNKVRAQVGKSDPALAQELIDDAQAVIDALKAG